MTIVTLGIDLAKNVFAVHGVDATGRAALVRPNIACGKLLELIASLPPCLIGMEACSGAHHWSRLFAGFGHTVRLMAPKFIVPYRLSGKPGVQGTSLWTGGIEPAIPVANRCPARTDNLLSVAAVIGLSLLFL